MSGGKKLSILETAQAFINAYMTERNYTMFDYIQQDGFECNTILNNDPLTGIDYDTFKTMMVNSHFNSVIGLVHKGGTPTFEQGDNNTVLVCICTEQLLKDTGRMPTDGQWHQVTGFIRLEFEEVDDQWKIHRLNTHFSMAAISPLAKAITPSYQEASGAGLDTLNTHITMRTCGSQLRRS